jgi:tol-pal system protein YbgF
VVKLGFFLLGAIAGLLPAVALAQRAPVTDLSTRSGSTSTAAAAAAPTPAAAEAAALRKAMADLTIEVDALRTELRELRGQLEVQTHELESLKTRNREALADTDKRLRDLERKATPAATAAPETAGPVAAPASADEQQQYDAAFALMKQGQYEKAAKAFREFIAKHPSSDLAGNAQYWVGEAYYVVRNFKQAIDDFTKVVDKYSTSSKVADALLKIGYSQQELGALDKARAALQQVVSRFPNTVSAKSAEKRLADIKAAEAKAAETKAKPVESKPKPADTRTKKP